MSRKIGALSLVDAEQDPPAAKLDDEREVSSASHSAEDVCVAVRAALVEVWALRPSRDVVNGQSWGISRQQIVKLIEDSLVTFDGVAEKRDG